MKRLLVLLLSAFLVLSSRVQDVLAVSGADAVREGLGVTRAIAGYSASASNQSIYIVIGRLFSVVLGTLGIVFLILLITGGILYLTSLGDETKIKKAKSLISSSIIGLVIIVAAYAIATYVLGSLSRMNR